jgi:hypothetical protein
MARRSWAVLGCRLVVMTAEEHRGLGLLIALASSGCLGLPRYTDDDDEVGDVEDDGTTMPAVDEGPGPPGPPGGPPGSGPQPTTAVDDAESFLFMPDIGPATSPTTAETSDVTTAPPPPSEACQAYSTLITECYGEGDGESAFYYCMQYLDYLGGYTPECVPSFEEYMVCISELSCGDLGDPAFCSDEVEAFEECQGG